MGQRHRARFCFTLALFLSAAETHLAYAAGELEGQVRGRVIEASTSAPVPGATVTVISPNLGAARVATTSEEGERDTHGSPCGRRDSAGSSSRQNLSG